MPLPNRVQQYYPSALDCCSLYHQLLVLCDTAKFCNCVESSTDLSAAASSFVEKNMQPVPSRPGLGLRPPLPSYGQGPSISALAQQQQQLHHPAFVPPQAQKYSTLFVG